VNNTNNFTGQNSYVVKFNATGDFQWRYEIDGNNGSFKDLDIYSYSIEELNTEYVYTSGLIQSGNGLHFGGSTITLQCDSSCWTRDPFVAKIDGSTGLIIWATKATTLPTNWSSWTHETENAISVDGNGNAILVGAFGADTMTFATNSNPIQLNNTGPNGNDGYIAKIDVTGSWQWAKKLGDVSSRSERVSDVDTDVGGNTIISGGFKAESLTIGNTTLNNSYSNGFDSDLFVAAIGANGEWLWANSAQGTQYDNGDLIALSSGTTGYVVGQTFGGITWGNDSDSTTYGGANQIFIGKFTFPQLIVDSDLDGVDDDNDLCPNTPLNSLVNQHGCLADFEITNGEIYEQNYVLGASLAISTLDEVFISAPLYSGSLELLKRNSSNGVISWDNEIVIHHSLRDYGHESSLFIDSSDNPHIAFHMLDNRSMEYAVMNQTVWDLTVIDDQGDNGIQNVGQQHDIVIDSMGTPHVIYNEFGAGSNWIYATSSENGTWVEEYKFTGMSAIGKNSLAIDSNDNLHLIFTHQDGSIVYATNENGYWDVNLTLDIQGNSLTFNNPENSNAAITVDDDDTIHVSYCLMQGGTNSYEIGNGSLIYSIKENGQWTNETVESNIDCASLNGKPGHSLVVDHYGFAHILYHKNSVAEWKPDDLVYATNVNSSWNRYVLLSQEDSIAEQTSIGVDSSNILHLIYEWRPNGQNQVITSYMELKRNWTSLDSDLDGVGDDNDLCPGTPQGATVNEDGCSLTQLDQDGDGVGDYIDQCPNTPTGETVDFFGCSQSQLDDDGDGVKNNVDQCPNTPAGESIDSVGCSQSQLDDDGDGVMNNVDQCPNTPAGESVDLVGCSQSQLDDDGDGVMNNVDQCPNTPVGVNVGPDGCNYPPVCTFSYENSSAVQTVFMQDLPLGTGTQIATLTLPPDSYEFHVECSDSESDIIQMSVSFDGGPASLFTGSPLVSGPIPIVLQDNMVLSKVITYDWSDGINNGSYQVTLSIGGDETAQPGDGWIPGFEFELVILALFLSLYFVSRKD
jgi:hypothetical protein